MNDLIVWLIIALFYAPVHYMLPILIVAFMTTDAALRKRRIVTIAIDCTVSMLVAFTIVLLMVADSIQLAMVVLLVSMFMPYIRVMRYHLGK